MKATQLPSPRYKVVDNEIDLRIILYKNFSVNHPSKLAFRQVCPMGRISAVEPLSKHHPSLLLFIAITASYVRKGSSRLIKEDEMI
jgi:hypothetical protein